MKINFMKIMQTLYIPLENIGPSSSYPVAIIQLCVYCSSHDSKKKIADRAWIAEVWRKPVTNLCHFIPSKPLLLQWLFNLLLRIKKKKFFFCGFKG